VNYITNKEQRTFPIFLPDSTIYGTKEQNGTKKKTVRYVTHRQSGKTPFFSGLLYKILLPKWFFSTAVFISFESV